MMPHDVSGLGRGQPGAAQVVAGEGYGLFAGNLSDLGASGRQESSRGLDDTQNSARDGMRFLLLKPTVGLGLDPSR